MQARFILAAKVHCENIGGGDGPPLCLDNQTEKDVAKLADIPRPLVLQENIKGLREETWEAINKAIIGYAQREKIESGA